jgi:prepilin-type processing-associated H-X9-DG protein
VDGLRPPFMFCPSTPLRNFPNLYINKANHVMKSGPPAPTYAALMGGVPDIGPVRQDLVSDPTIIMNAAKNPLHPDSLYNPHTHILSRNTTSHNVLGSMSGGGAFPPGQVITFASFRDGTSNVIMVVEQSDFGTFYQDPTPRKYDFRSTNGPGFLWGATKQFGTRLSTNKNKASPPVAWNANGSQRCGNCTAVRYPINTKVDSNSNGAVNGIITDSLMHTGNYQYVHNAGIFAAHAGGANCLFGDGSVKLLRETMSMPVVLQLACRDDQVPMSEQP